LEAESTAALQAQARAAQATGAAAVFVARGSLGDPVVLAAGIADAAPELEVGVRIALADDGRHPAMLARDLTSLDLVCAGRSVVCFVPPFTEDLPEAIRLCRALWGQGAVSSEGPAFPAQAPVNRARPATASTPRVALDLTAPDAPSPADAGGPSRLVGFDELVELVDIVLRPTGMPDVCQMEPA
jgi:alkanesulfonate monooxygenase SsuD/methylene tetrahydromethanopterin reductase-like flavin-dependent oxidoreductase (luciferase family)